MPQSAKNEMYSQEKYEGPPSEESSLNAQYVQNQVLNCSQTSLSNYCVSQKRSNYRVVQKDLLLSVEIETLG